MVRVSVKTQTSQYGRKYGKYRKRKSKAATGRRQVLNISEAELRKAFMKASDLHYVPVLIDDEPPQESLASTPVTIATTRANGGHVTNGALTAIELGDGPFARQDNSVSISRIMLKGCIYWAGSSSPASNYVPQNTRVIVIRTNDSRPTSPDLSEFLDLSISTFPTPDYGPAYAPVKVRNERRGIQILYDKMYLDPGVEAVGSAFTYTSQRYVNINLRSKGGWEVNYTGSSSSAFNTSSGAIWMYFLLDDNAVAGVEPRNVYMRAQGRVEFKDL